MFGGLYIAFGRRNTARSLRMTPEVLAGSPDYDQSAGFYSGRTAVFPLVGRRFKSRPAAAGIKKNVQRVRWSGGRIYSDRAAFFLMPAAAGFEPATHEWAVGKQRFYTTEPTLGPPPAAHCCPPVWM